MLVRFLINNKRQSVMKPITKKAFLLTALPMLALTGCATTATLKQADCSSANWEQVGRADGLRGANSQEILRHAKTCQGLATPDRALWEQGRQTGLKSYCTIDNAYNMGRMGYTLQGVCDVGDSKTLEELHRANMMGLEQHQMSERMTRMHYGYGGWYGYPYRPYWWW